MKLNLDSLKAEIQSYLKDNGFVVFHAFSRSLDDMPEVDWDTRRYPDYKEFLSVAKRLEAPLIVFHHREFSSDIVDRAIEDLPAAGLDYDDQRAYEQRLRELSVYEGFTCLIEISFDPKGTSQCYFHRGGSCPIRIRRRNRLLRASFGIAVCATRPPWNAS